MHRRVAMYTSVGTPFSLVTRLVRMVEELMHGRVAMYTLLRTPLSVVTQSARLVEE